MKIFNSLRKFYSNNFNVFQNNSDSQVSVFKKFSHDVSYYFKKIKNFILQFLFSLMKQIFSLKKDSRKAAVNNFRLGLMFLKKGKLSDAKLRFWLASKFYPSSSTNLYYLAYVNYLQGNINKCLIYLQSALDKKSSNIIRIAQLFERISKTSPDIFKKEQ